jgi:hypothetical protein
LYWRAQNLLVPFTLFTGVHRCVRLRGIFNCAAFMQSATDLMQKRAALEKYARDVQMTRFTIVRQKPVS